MPMRRMQADRFGTLLEKHSFQYDPSEHHGPALAYATLPAAWIARQWRYADLNEWTLRVTPALAGLALVDGVVRDREAGRLRRRSHGRPLHSGLRRLSFTTAATTFPRCCWCSSQPG